MYSANQQDEKDLLTRVSEGDDNAFSILFHRYWDHVYSVALILTKSPEAAADIGQEVFLELLKTRSQMTAIDNLQAFLYTIGKRLALKKLRRMKVEEAYAHYLSGQLTVFESATADAEIQVNEVAGILRQGIELLPPQQKKAFLYSRDQRLTHEQISAIMGVSKKTVKDYIVRAIAFLKHFLQHYAPLLSLVVGLAMSIKK